KTILSAAAVLMIMSLGGALLGVYKLHAFSALLSPNDLVQRDSLDAFKAAFRIPDMVFQILIAGALNAAFIPVFGALLQKKRLDEAWRLTASMMSSALIFFALLALVVFVFA